MALGDALGDDLQVEIVDRKIVAALHEQATGHRLDADAHGAGVGKTAGHQQPQVLLRGNDRLRLLARFRRDDHLGKGLDDLLGGFRVERPVHRDDPAECRDRVAGERLEIGLLQRSAFGNAARVGVLDDRHGRTALRIELADQFESRVGVVDVVVGELLALQLPRGCNSGTLFAGDVEAGLLVGVLSIAHHAVQPAAECAPCRMLDLEGLREPARNRRIVGGRARECLGREFLAKLQRQAAEIQLQRVEHRGIVLRVGARLQHRRGSWPRRAPWQARRCRCSRRSRHSRRPTA